MYQIELRHDGLHKHRLIRGRDRYIVEQKAALQQAAWAEQWARRQATDAKRQAIEDGKQEADDRTREAQETLQAIDTILAHTLTVNDAIDWDSLRNHRRFAEPVPAKPDPATFEAKKDLLDLLWPARKQRKIAAASQALRLAMETCKRRRADWQQRHDRYEAERAAANAAVDDQERRYRAREPSAIEEYCDLVLSRSHYPDLFPKEFHVAYQADSRTIAIDYELPPFDDLPRLKEVRYVASKGEFKETNLKDAEAQRLYDCALYQVCLRTIHEIFEADVVQAVETVAFNGWVEAVNRGTGQLTRGCILSVVATKEAFSKIKLAAVEPKACFKSLKGVSASQLAGMTPIPPVLQLNKTDPRFVAGVEVAGKLSEGTNIAAIGWEEFEHLIREVFEKELRSSGGEVKITRASRDEGVDAVAFDPDPIRGGKIIIQAKRYTNTVGVGAVRDLYGTVVNEGATKGILVTTSSFGPDSYSFAQDKPIVLMDGSNLLHLLSRHGVAARIDLKEAKQLDGALKRVRT